MKTRRKKAKGNPQEEMEAAIKELEIVSRPPITEYYQLPHLHTVLLFFPLVILHSFLSNDVIIRSL